MLIIRRSWRTNAGTKGTVRMDDSDKSLPRSILVDTKNEAQDIPRLVGLSRVTDSGRLDAPTADVLHPGSWTWQPRSEGPEA